MREIKFSYIYQHDDTGRILNKKFDIHEIELELMGECFIERYTLIARRQYTGLKDKNSVGIYEGDVGNDKFNNKVVVKWNEQFYCYALLTIDEIVKDDWNFDLNDLIEVIGNIYEHSNLLDNN